MDRRRFVGGSILAGTSLASGATAQADDNAVRIPMNVEIEPSWLTWVTAVNGCLRALGVDCDNVEVAGHSGYAFHMCITDVAGVEGPTTLPWSDLSCGPRMLGRSTTEFQMGAWGEPADWQAGERALFDLAKREVDAGRPSVMWGTGNPEFGIIVGYEGDEVLYRWSHSADELRVRCGDLQDPGGPYGLTFPSTTTVAPVVRDRAALVNALDFLHRGPDHPRHRFGLAAYDQWVEALQAKRAPGFGNSYCAQCFANGREYARDFVARLRNRTPHAEGPLDAAALAYAECAEAMGAVAQLFPFPGGAENVEGLVTIADAVEALTAARDAETKAAEATEEALEVEWPEE